MPQNLKISFKNTKISEEDSPSEQSPSTTLFNVMINDLPAQLKLKMLSQLCKENN
jgi:transcriptional regulator of acetoin/glycerol metabolism